MFLKRNHLAWLIGRLAPKMEELRKHRCRRGGPTKRLLLYLLLNICHHGGVVASKNQRRKKWFKMLRQQIEEGHSQTC